MTGFVDPAFKNIKVTEPNFFIWRMSKSPKENYEAKQIRKEYYGNFYDEDSYIIYNSTPFKKILGRPNRGRESKMEIHIHFWLGSNTTDDERDRTIIKTMELDEVLEGAGTLHRELQGYESSRFLSYFKDGMFIKKGEITSVLIQNRVDQNDKLYELCQRSSTLILTEQPAISWTFMNSSSVFVLEKRSRVFVWFGSEVSLEERQSALQVDKLMETNDSNRKLVPVFDGSESELADDELTDFEESLKLKSKLDVVLNSTQKDFLTLQSEYRAVTTLYKVVQGKFSTITYVKDGPLKQSDLDSMDICIVDHIMNGVWIWVCKKVRNEQKSRSINVAISYLNEKSRYKVPQEWKLAVHRVVEGSEPQEFKLLFKSWIDTYPLHPDIYFLKKLGKPVNMKFNAEKLEESPFLAAETQLLDCGGGKMTVSRVKNGKLVHLDPEEFGIFHSNYQYLVSYTYEINGEKKKILYSWLGKRLSLKDRENYWPQIKHLPEYRDVCVRVRIEEQRETPHFYAIFQGKIIVLNRNLPIVNWTKMVLDNYPLLLLKVTGGDVLNCLSIEITPGAFSLCSDNVFILRTQTLSYIWCGASSKGDEREMARSVANKWTREYKVIVEGYESKDFREFMGKYRLGVGLHRREIVPAQINVPATLHKCFLSEEGFRVSEVLNFDKSDLGSSDIIILDAWDIIFVWIGQDVTEENSSKDKDIVRRYFQSDPCGRAPNLPIIYVSQNHEPPTFRGFFPTWTKERKETPEVIPEGEYSKQPPKKTPTVIFGGKTPKEVPQGEKLSESQSESKVAENLSNYEFWRKFGIKREVFNQYPPCKQRYIKKLAGY